LLAEALRPRLLALQLERVGLERGPQPRVGADQRRVQSPRAEHHRV
jgi:hypothetical protein